MKSSGRACGLLLLTMAVASSGRNAREYFQQAGFQYSPASIEDAFVIFTASAPPLICEPEKVGDWAGGDASEASFRLRLPDGFTAYTCSFEGNATTFASLSLLHRSVPLVFRTGGSGNVVYDKSDMYCTTDSQLPDEYFQMKVQRPHETHPVKCRLHRAGLTLYLRFPGYPTIVCKFFYTESLYLFNLPGIADHPFKCAFRMYSELRLVDTPTEERLYHSLVNELERRPNGVPSRYVCSPQATLNGSTHFQLLLPGGSIYDCSFSNA